ncbi:PRHOXNB [Lepeophtheirus salmonis]|uniref:2-oxo-4-hydroxy-4-carboxy-5-ureidoimidazoline decarboxylase n=1 Tax=Lepeophtheirus salmonis TaxID=72036 RepID=A0A7R8D6S1_LEPSM|nr:PRHOXNB [Lepeophtheirus salmonis]CAF3043668.1 PRHOXNB [Lepeophtheirus salmonis]
MDNLSIENKVSILRMHPILGDKVPASALDSTNEQSYLGVKNVSQETLDYLNDLNQKYLNKFKFPFVICVKKKSFDEVLIEIAERCTKLYEEEVSLGVEEVKKICEIRILDTYILTQFNWDHLDHEQLEKLLISLCNKHRLKFHLPSLITK